jgi:hypothetical protein
MWLNTSTDYWDSEKFHRCFNFGLSLTILLSASKLFTGAIQSCTCMHPIYIFPRNERDRRQFNRMGVDIGHMVFAKLLQVTRCSVLGRRARALRVPSTGHATSAHLIQRRRRGSFLPQPEISGEERPAKSSASPLHLLLETSSMVAVGWCGGWVAVYM